MDGGNQPRGCSEASAMYKSRKMFLHPDLFFLGDLAYVLDTRCRTGYKNPQLTIADAGSAAEVARRKAYNASLSSHRVRVEHSFSRVKHTWRLMQSTWNQPIADLPKAFRASCLLANWLRRTRNLYDNI